jgi:hypothetical protein
VSVAVPANSPRTCSGLPYSGVRTRVTASGAAGGSFADHFGDSEIEQLGNTLGGDQDVIRLQVPMYDQLLVRELNGFADRQHQLDALPRRELALVAEPVDGLAGYVLHNEVGQAIVSGAGVDQPGDVGMLQTRQDAALLLQAVRRENRPVRTEPP